MLNDWVKMQIKCNAEIYLLEENGDKKMFKATKKIEPRAGNGWIEERSVTYHVFDGGKWVIATEDYRTAYKIYENLVKEKVCNG